VTTSTPATSIPHATAIRSIEYTAPSATEQGVTYTVKVDDAGWHCECKAGHYRRLCWHRKAAQTGLLGKPIVRVEWTVPAALSEHEAAITAAQMSRAAYLAAAKTAPASLADLYGD
jgi:hypothetical protein